MNEWSPLMMAAQSNFRNHLGQNSYPGRGIVIGLDEAGKHLVQVYWIMGRSDNSRNRIFDAEGTDRVFTVAADPSKVKDPSLIIYNAMDIAYGGDEEVHVVSNGSQTDLVVKYLYSDDPFEGLCDVKYEPDDPNFTPRITAVTGWGRKDDLLLPTGAIWLVRRSPWGEGADHALYPYTEFGAGFGYCVTTYKCNGDPLPPFRGEPILMPLVGSIEKIAETYWAALNQENKVALVVKFIPQEGSPSVHIINKLTKLV